MLLLDREGLKSKAGRAERDSSWVLEGLVE